MSGFSDKGRRAALGGAAAALLTPRALAAAPPAPRDEAPSRFDLRRFGAIGDGRSHPLAERFSNLAAARRVFPAAQSLEQEIDGCALQAAVDAAQAAGGGAVQAGSGVFILDRPVIFPEARQGHGAGPQGGVSLFGAGQGATLFRALRDFPGYMLDCAGRFTTRWGSQGVWQDFSLLGPGGNAGWGTENCALGGLGWGARRAVSRISVQDCRVGISITGDQGMLDRVLALSCFYGIYFDRPNPHLFGDHLFAKIILDGSWRAAIGVHPDATVPKSRWDSPVLAASPFGIYKELGGESDFALRAVEMAHAQFENIGLAAISGGAARGPQGEARPDVQNLRLSMPQIGPWDEARRIPGWRRAAMLDLRQVHQGLVVAGINEPNLWRPGEAALLRLDHPGALSLSGDVDALLQGCAESGRPFLEAAERSDAMVLEQTGRWSGRIYQANGDIAVREGDVLVHRDGNVQPSRGEAGEVVAGICMLAAAGPYAAVVVADRGQVPVAAARDGFDNCLLRAGPGGMAVLEGEGPPLGWAYPGGPGRALIRLRGLA